MYDTRYLSSFLAHDLAEKMVFLGGPRQVGKTTLAKKVGESSFKNPSYYNWDTPDDAKKILGTQFSPDMDFLMLDEIHKYGNWKNFVKGLYDKYHEKYHILVTGSARLDMYQRGGDSLLGRYHYWRLHPFSVAEGLSLPIPQNIEECVYAKTPTLPLSFQKSVEAEKVFHILFTHGGFPEPFFAQNTRSTKRWQKERKKRLLREDIRDTSNIHDLSKLQMLMDMLPERVGSLLSLESLRQDLSVAHQTIAKWLEIFEHFYYAYRIYPFSASLSKSLKKEPKLYLWDWAEEENEPVRFENCIAGHLLKFVHFIEDAYGVDIRLQYWRDKDGREVDFIVVLEGRAIWAIEVKMTDQKPSKHLKYLKERISLEKCFQIVKTPEVDFEKDGIRVISASTFLTGLV